MLECTLGSESVDARSAFLWGDSHAGHFNPFLDSIGKRDNISITDRSTPACIPSFQSASHARSPEICAVYKADLEANMQGYDMAFIAARWEVLTEDSYREVEQALTKISDNVDRVYVIIQVPSYLVNYRDCFIKGAVFGFGGCDKQNTDGAYLRYTASKKRIADVVARFPAVTLIDPAAAYCDASACSPYLEGERPLYFDRDHLSVEGARLLAEQFEPI